MGVDESYTLCSAEVEAYMSPRWGFRIGVSMSAINMSPLWGYVVHRLWALSRHKICPYIELIAQNQCRDMNLDLYRFYIQYLSSRWGFSTETGRTRNGGSPLAVATPLGFLLVHGVDESYTLCSAEVEAYMSPRWGFRIGVSTSAINMSPRWG